MNQKILVVGGYGKVGSVVTKRLATQFPGLVIVGGRNEAKAKTYANSLMNNVSSILLDVESKSFEDELLKGVGIVVMCIDQSNTRFVKHCIENSVCYIDVTATYSMLKEVELLHDTAVKHDSTVILSVGIAPGLTNLLALQCKLKRPEVRFVDVFILLGLGDEHGEAAIRWSLEALSEDFEPSTLGGSTLTKGKESIFPADLGKRMAYYFNFSDQFVIQNTLGYLSATTRMCFDSRFVTFVSNALRKLRFNRVLRFDRVQNSIVYLMKRYRFGTDRFAVKVEARSEEQGQPVYQCALMGAQESRTTGLVAALVAEQLQTSSFASGVYHIEQLFDPVMVLNRMQEFGLFYEEGIFPVEHLKQ